MCPLPPASMLGNILILATPEIADLDIKTNTHTHTPQIKVNYRDTYSLRRGEIVNEQLHNKHTRYILLSWQQPGQQDIYPIVMATD